jgi:hypothetical protein
MEMAQDRGAWNLMINGIWTQEKDIVIHEVLSRRAGVV